MSDSNAAVAPLQNGVTCAGCGSVFPSALLVCPDCQRLVHADALKRLQERAAEHAARGERSDELSAWREALALLPVSSRQHALVSRKLQELTAQAPASAARPAQDKRALGKLTGLGALALVLWKFKALFAFALTKGKLLLLGMTKFSTLFSMVLSLGVYWSLWGFWFALGFVLSLYVHEMGHVFALRRLGIAASAPMFIPGVGAFVRMKQYPATANEDAQVGLAGPIFGLGAALGCFALFHVTGHPLFAALARTGAWLNLFNLLPAWSLDGGRGFRALDRRQRWLAAGAIGAAFLLSGEGLLLVLGLVAAGRAAWGEQTEHGDRSAFYTYVGLIGALAWLGSIHIPLVTEAAGQLGIAP